MIELERPRRSLWTLLTPVGVLAILALIYWLMAPRLTSFSPGEAEAGVAADQPIQLGFSRSMDAASVEKRLSLDPQVPGQWRWQGNTATFEPSANWPEGATVNVTLAAGARSSLYLPMLTGRSWSFQVVKSRIAYLDQSRGRTVLMGRALDGGEPQPLIGAATNVASYDFAPDGSLATVEIVPDGQSIVRWRPGLNEAPIDLRVCPPDQECDAVAISPSGAWVAWEQRPIQRSETGILNVGKGSVWVASPTAVGASQPVTSSLTNLESPSWPASDALAVLDADTDYIHIFKPGDDGWVDSIDPIPHPLGEQWSWSPDGRFVVLPEVEFTPAASTGTGDVGFFSHLYRVEVSSGLRTDLTRREADRVEDASPAYSPDGLLIAFARKSLVLNEWTLGRQLWLMRSDGSDSRALTSGGNRNHAHLRWSADGTRLAFVVFDATNPDRPPEVWWMNLESGEEQELVAGGFAPEWIP